MPGFYKFFSPLTRGRLSSAALLLMVHVLFSVATSDAAPTRKPVSVPGSSVVYYLYNLSDFTGPKNYSASTLAIDLTRDEPYVLTGGSISVFDKNGMELYSMEPDSSLGSIYDVAPLPDGSILLLSIHDSRMRIIKANYRGEAVGEIVLRGLPAGLSDFTANAMRYHNGKIYLLGGSQLLVAGLDGVVTNRYDLMEAMGIKQKDRENSEIGGLAIDKDGSILFTLPITAKVCRFIPETGKVESFGKRGSRTGGFGVPSGIAIDQSGNLLITDRLRGAVLVYSGDFTFRTEFGGNLIVPTSIVVDREGLVYVSQYRNQGVSVYHISDAPPPPPAK